MPPEGGHEGCVREKREGSCDRDRKGPEPRERGVPLRSRKRNESRVSQVGLGGRISFGRGVNKTLGQRTNISSVVVMLGSIKQTKERTSDGESDLTFESLPSFTQSEQGLYREPCIYPNS